MKALDRALAMAKFDRNRENAKTHLTTIDSAYPTGSAALSRADASLTQLEVDLKRATEQAAGSAVLLGKLALKNTELALFRANILTARKLESEFATVREQAKEAHDAIVNHPKKIKDADPVITAQEPIMAARLATANTFLSTSTSVEIAINNTKPSVNVLVQEVADDAAKRAAAEMARVQEAADAARKIAAEAERLRAEAEAARVAAAADAARLQAERDTLQRAAEVAQAERQAERERMRREAEEAAKRDEDALAALRAEIEANAKRRAEENRKQMEALRNQMAIQAAEDERRTEALRTIALTAVSRANTAGEALGAAAAIDGARISAIEDALSGSTDGSTTDPVSAAGATPPRMFLVSSGVEPHPSLAALAVGSASASTPPAPTVADDHNARAEGQPPASSPEGQHVATPPGGPATVGASAAVAGEPSTTEPGESESPRAATKRAQIY